MKTTPETVADIRSEALFTADRVGAEGSVVRVRAQWTLALLDDFSALEAFVRKIETMRRHSRPSDWEGCACFGCEARALLDGGK